MGWPRLSPPAPELLLGQRSHPDLTAESAPEFLSVELVELEQLALEKLTVHDHESLAALARHPVAELRELDGNLAYLRY